MSALVIATLVVAALLVLALAAYLVAIAAVLVQVQRAVGRILRSIRGIVQRTEPLGSLLGPVEEDLVATRGRVREVTGHPEPPAGSYIERRHRVRP